MSKADLTKPWISTVYENLSMAEYATSTTLNSKNRIAFILIHNASEILLRNFLNVNNQSDAFDSSVQYPQLLERVYSFNNKFGTLKNEFLKNKLRNKLDHIGSGLSVEDAIITFYQDWVERSISILFKCRINEIKKNVKQIEQSNEYMRLKIGDKPLLPTPLNELVFRVFIFHLRFTIENDGKESGTAQVYVHSPSKALSLVFDVPRKAHFSWFRKEKTREYGDADKKEQYVGPGGKAHLLFNFRLDVRSGEAIRLALTLGYVPINVNASIRFHDGTICKIETVTYKVLFEEEEGSVSKKKNKQKRTEKTTGTP